mmetsp:Transcript_25385/g.54609  ORF Transcript_25385/g.54609 Transcript_25385/m.54609 type:complete len:593 (-) Transcript_25385:473-2251(-)
MEQQQQQQQAKRRRSNNDGKNATSKSANGGLLEEVHIELMTESWKKGVLEKFPRCQAAEGIRDTSYFATTSKGRDMAASASTGQHRYASRGAGPPTSSTAVGGMSNIHCLRKLLSELNRMEYEDSEQLPGGTAPIWLRYDDECPQYMRALVTGPPRDTPYSNGLFCFDIYVPDAYPNVSPTVQLLTTGGGSVRFGPNLYANGKVCLSLLNTWSGPKWDPGQSSILQILVSIQGLILGVAHPYYLEPGHGGWEGSHSNTAVIANHGQAAGSGAAKSGAGIGISSGGQSYIPSNVKRYEDSIRMATMKYAITEYCRSLGTTTSRPNYLSAFEDILRSHFWHRKDCILADANKWVSMVCSQSQMRPMQAALKGLESALGQLKEPPTLETTASASDGTAAASTAVDGNDAGKPLAVSAGGSSTSPETAAKRREMEAAVAKGDYITAGRIQAQLESSAKVHDTIVSKRKEMDDAAAKKDYVKAGRLQLIVKHLECNRMRLQDLERRMFEYASRQDFVKAGRFQEQYRVLLETAGADSASSPAGASSAVAKVPIRSGDIGGAIASALTGGYGMPASMMGGGGGYYDDYAGAYPDDYDY